MESKPAPPNWGKDLLSDTLTTYFNNVYATFHNCSEVYDLIREITDLFELIGRNPGSGHAIGLLLLPKSYGAFVAASALASGGFASEAHAVSRTCLECAMRSLYIDKKSLAEEYITKNDDGDTKKRFKKIFQQANISSFLSHKYPHIAKHAIELYETTLNFGGHPDPFSTLFTTQISESSGNKEILCEILTNNPLLIVGTVKTVARVGICSLDLFRESFKERFDLLGITDKITRLKKQL